MRAETAQAQAVDERSLLESLQVAGIFLAVHLDVQDFNRVEAHAGGLVDALFDGELRVVLEAPEGIGRDADGVAALRGASVGGRRSRSRRRFGGNDSRRRCGEESTGSGRVFNEVPASG